jgi:hypothetical protein
LPDLLVHAIKESSSIILVSEQVYQLKPSNDMLVPNSSEVRILFIQPGELLKNDEYQDDNRGKENSR